MDYLLSALTRGNLILPFRVKPYFPQVDAEFSCSLTVCRNGSVKTWPVTGTQGRHLDFPEIQNGDSSWRFFTFRSLAFLIKDICFF